MSSDSAASGTRYNKLSEELQQRIKKDRESGRQNEWRCRDEQVVRRDPSRDRASLWRPAYVRDTEKIIHLPYYNRYADKTQVFSFYNNDDITRRALHVQLVSRIARSIGSVLGLNLDLIEAIALGHDIGHTPFGHAGERFLSDLLHAETGRYFNHNVHSVRVLDFIFRRNLSLQTLDGILCHNGEFEQKEYRPQFDKSFEDYDKSVESCYVNGKAAIERLVPKTLEGCVVRICDMIAYLGKDRQDAYVAKIIPPDYKFSTELLGDQNAKIINNLTVDIIENSYGKDHIRLSDKAYSDLKSMKEENNAVIYRDARMNEQYNEIIMPMFRELYYRLLSDVVKKDRESLIYRHHVRLVNNARKSYDGADYFDGEPNQIVADYIASMTDDYFIALHKKLFPNSRFRITYKPYFGD